MFMNIVNENLMQFRQSLNTIFHCYICNIQHKMIQTNNVINNSKYNIN